MSAVPRVVVSAPSSGHGKTALAVGLLAAFAGRGLSATGFKVGPDHTDAAYLGAAASSAGRNLDPRMVGGHRIGPLFAHGAEGSDIAVIEGTMGLFDSLAGRVETDSTAGVAATLRAPVVMVVDVAAMGQSVAALVHGFRAYDELTWLGGVILNRVASDRHEQLLRESLDDIGVPVFGALRRRDLPSTLPPRHEGVVPVAQRSVDALRGIRRLGESVAAAVDLDRLLALARSAPRLAITPWSPADELANTSDDTAAVVAGRRPVVALAGGPAVSFVYAETRELLEAAGATVVTVDPLRDEALPTGTDALVIGGALPEAYAEELSANRHLCADVADLARSGRPVIAEGAGLLWLANAFDGRPMCGVLDAVGTTTDQMIVGYRDATARASTPVAQLGSRLVGYKQHRGVVTPRAGQTPAWTWNGGSPEGFVWRRVHASQLTLHWAGSPEIARRLVAAAQPAASAPPADRAWAGATGALPMVGPPVDPTTIGTPPHIPGTAAYGPPAAMPPAGPTAHGPALPSPGVPGAGRSGPGGSGPAVSGSGGSALGVPGAGRSGPGVSGPAVSGPGGSAPGVPGAGRSGPGGSAPGVPGAERSGPGGSGPGVPGAGLPGPGGPGTGLGPHETRMPNQGRPDTDRNASAHDTRMAGPGGPGTDRGHNPPTTRVAGPGGPGGAGRPDTRPLSPGGPGRGPGAHDTRPGEPGGPGSGPRGTSGHDTGTPSAGGPAAGFGGPGTGGPGPGRPVSGMDIPHPRSALPGPGAPHAGAYPGGGIGGYPAGGDALPLRPVFGAPPGGALTDGTAEVPTVTPRPPLPGTPRMDDRGIG